MEEGESKWRESLLYVHTYVVCVCVTRCSFSFPLDNESCGYIIPSLYYYFSLYPSPLHVVAAQEQKCSRKF